MRINNSVEVIGSASTPGNHRLFRWTPGSGYELLPLPYPSARYAYLSDLNERGQILGASGGNDTPSVGILWDPQRGIVIPQGDPCYGSAWYVGGDAINDRGQIATSYAVYSPYLTGDLDGSGTVDVADLARLLANFGRSGATFTDGDGDCDGDVDLQDLAGLLADFGDSLP